MTPQERENLCRYRADGRGHVESYFLKANAPDRDLAVWVKLTILEPKGRPGAAVAETWAIVFDGPGRHVAAKDTAPLAEASFGRDRFEVRTPSASLEAGRTTGAVGGGRVRWDLRFTGWAPPVRHLPWDWMYSAPFPRSKLCAPWPDARFEGTIEVEGRTIEVRGWPGTEGHNWGRGHAWRYAWAHCDAFEGAPDTFVDGASASIKLGPLVTPLSTVMGARWRGRDLAFGDLRTLRAPASIEYFRWRFRAENADVRLDGEVDADRADVVALRYVNPSGPDTTCLNSKLATMRVTISTRGPSGWEVQERLESRRRAALEIGTTATDHGVPITV